MAPLNPDWHRRRSEKFCNFRLLNPPCVSNASAGYIKLCKVKLVLANLPRNWLRFSGNLAGTKVIQLTMVRSPMPLLRCYIAFKKISHASGCHCLHLHGEMHCLHILYGISRNLKLHKRFRYMLRLQLISPEIVNINALNAILSPTRRELLLCTELSNTSIALLCRHLCALCASITSRQYMELEGITNISPVLAFVFPLRQQYLAVQLAILQTIMQFVPEPGNTMIKERNASTQRTRPSTVSPHPGMPMQVMIAQGTIATRAPPSKVVRKHLSNHSNVQEVIDM